MDKRFDNEIRIVLVGKTGTGKSFLGNNLLGVKQFKTKAGGSSTTTRCEKGCRGLEHGKKMIIIDTPGLHGNTKSSDEFCQCIGLSDPGVHAFILVLRIGRFTKEELETVKKLQSLFGENVAKHAIVVFTDKASLDTDDQSLDEYIEESPENLKLLLRQCGGRFVAVDNLIKGKDLQVYMKGVMDLIYKTIDANYGRSYTGEMFAAAEMEVQRGMEDLQLQRLMATPHSVDNEIRIVLLGKTGKGKSALGNNLLGTRKFVSKSSSSSVTSKCKQDSVQLSDGKSLLIVDTPGLYDTGKSQKETAIEVCRCISLTAPGVHAFILVLQIGRFTEEELDTIKQLQKLFGENVTKHAFVVFTYKGNLDDDQTLEDFIEDSPGSLQLMLTQCGSRCVAVDNKAKGEDLQADMGDVMDLIYKTMAANRGTFYTGEMYAAAEREMQEEMRKIQAEKDEKIRAIEEQKAELLAREAGIEADKKRLELEKERQRLVDIDIREAARKQKEESEGSNSFCAIL